MLHSPSIFDTNSSDCDSEEISSSFKLNCNKDHPFSDHAPTGPNYNIVNKLINRQMYGTIRRNSKSNTDRFFKDIYYKCRFMLINIIPKQAVRHIYMGFTLCSNFFISYTNRQVHRPGSEFRNIEYVVYIWRFVPGEKLKFVSKHALFKLLHSSLEVDDVIFMQFPTDPYKIICYSIVGEATPMSSLTILTLPTKNCKTCKYNKFGVKDNLVEGYCSKHGFTMDFLFTLSNPVPEFNPHISLAYPDHIVINTGHCIHILNFTTLEPIKNLISFSQEYPNIKQISCHCTDNLSVSEISESPSEICSGSNSIVDAILDDFGEYDLEGNEHKPFHELNISCDPLNVTGKTYHNSIVHNISDNRKKHFHNGNNKDCLFSIPQSSGIQKQLERNKIDKKVLEKTYEFTEENEKCEKLSLFRKKRLADKKYEFSEDNSENIVPFYSLRREKRCLHRSHNHYIKSPEFKSLFLSPRSPSLRSPMQSPNSRSGQFSPVATRNMSSSFIRTTPNVSKAPISPRESARKINVYSPGLDSDCSDSESRLILRPAQNGSTSHFCDSKVASHNSLLIAGTKQDESPKWIKKVVKRYSSGDFENISLLSGQSRDDNNVPFEIPVLVQGMLDYNPDVYPDFKSETQLIITQRTLDCDRFVQNRAQTLCQEANVEFLHCEDYDIKIIEICPLNGHIICEAKISIGALEDLVPYVKRMLYETDFLFTWNIVDNTFNLIEPGTLRLQSESKTKSPLMDIPSIAHRKVLVMEHTQSLSKISLKDYNTCYEICMQDTATMIVLGDEYEEFSIPSDSDLDF